MISFFPSWLREGILVLLFVLMVALPISPLNSPFTYRDSGVFLYTGWRILNGALPYVDVWDHKPPVIYYINALGLALSNNSVLGVWVIELIALFLAAMLGFQLIKKMFGYHPAILGTFIWLLTLFFIIQGGNLTTEYILPLQFGTLASLYAARKNEEKVIYYLIIGLLGGIAFFTKQTAIALWLAIVIYWFLKGLMEQSFKQSLKVIAIVFAGALLIPLIFVIYFLLHQAMSEFWDAAFLYNFVYSIRKASGLKEWLLNFLDFSDLTRTGLLQIAFIGITAFFAVSNRKKLSDPTQSLMMVVVIAFPLELLLINAPGSTFPHYFMTLLPVLAVLAAFVFYLIDTWIGESKPFQLTHWVWTLSVIGLLAVGSVRDYRNIALGLQARIHEPAIQYICTHTDEEDMVLMWGAETMVNFFAKRVSPTRYAYQYALGREAYVTEARVIEFLDDILNNEPALIINTQDKFTPLFIFPITSAAIEEKAALARSRYVVVDEIENDWEVFRIIKK